MYSADEIASVIIARATSSLTAMQLQKLLYYVQAWHVAITDEPLFSERFKAWADGPVVPQVWHLRRDPASRVPANQHADAVDLDDLTSNVIELVLASYGSMSGDELSALTHIERPWLEARRDLPADAQSSEPIPIESMAAFYRSSRKLGNRTAADLAAGGVHLRTQHIVDEFDIDAFLKSLSLEDGADRFGGGNLEPVTEIAEGVETEARRAYLSA